MQFFRSKNPHRASVILFLGAVTIVIGGLVTLVFAAPPTSPYNPGDTLAPICAPGDEYCTVITPWTPSGGNVYRESGNVGIGTADPFGPLHVFGSADPPVDYPQVWIGNFIGGYGGPPTAGKGVFLGYDFGNDLGIFVSADFNANQFAPLGIFGGPILFGGGVPLDAEPPTIAMTIMDDKVGIGTTDPNYKLDVNGSFNATSIYLDNSELSPTPGTSVWSEDSGNVWRAGGFVGIGMADPMDTLDVNGTGHFQETLMLDGDLYVGTGNVGIGTMIPESKLHIENVTGTESEIGLHTSTTLDADVDLVIGIHSFVNGLPAGGLNGNTTYAFVADLNGTEADEDHSYEAFFAGPFNNNGGQGDATAFTALTGYNELLYAESGDVIFAKYDANIYSARDTDGAGHNISLHAGDGMGAGDQDGGDLFFYGGNAANAGTDGDVILAHTGSAAQGNVGIGTTDPISLLHIFDDGSSGGPQFVLGTLTADGGSFTSGEGTVLGYDFTQDISMFVSVDANNNQHAPIGILGNPIQFGSGALDADPLWAMTIMGDGNVGIGTENPESKLHVPDGKYAQFEDNNEGPPLTEDCDSDAERGRLSIDTTDNRLYICNGAVRGWDYISLTD